MPPSDADRKLVEQILAGSVEAWHRFVELYTGLLWATLRQHLRAEDEDEMRGAYVDLLHDLYHGRLSRFEGRSKLSTWLVLVARNAAFDRLRRIYGRSRTPATWRSLDPLAREVYRLHVVEGLRFDFVRRLARPRGPALAEEELLEVLARLRAAGLERRVRVRPRRGQRISGSPRISVDEYAQHLQRLHAETADDAHPEAVLARRELVLVHRRLIRELRRLPLEERRALYLRFWRRLTARAIAARLGLSRERQAYTYLDRALHKLRVALEQDLR